MILGAIGDDFTGSSDLGLILSQGGMRTVQYVGTPAKPAAPEVEAGIVALKTRSIPPRDAVQQSLEALEWLRAQGCRQFLFKYCSTFDSTPQGNIGPVIDALIDALGTQDPVIVCPAFPATGRTIYRGHLFVWDKLLSESGMENHPITPMTDPDIRRWLQLQTQRPVGHVAVDAIRSGTARESLMEQAGDGRQIVICDAIDDADLIELGAAAEGFALLTGGSGIALGLPRLYAERTPEDIAWRGEPGRAIILSGSCSQATRDQITRHAGTGAPQLKVEATELVDGRQSAEKALEWALAQEGVPLVFSSDDPASVKAAQSELGADRAAEAIETFFGELADMAVKAGVTRLISAGGETSGAVVGALGVDALEIGPMIDPGVPALRVAGKDLVLALKSGNFGAPDFFCKAYDVMGSR